MIEEVGQLEPGELEAVEKGNCGDGKAKGKG